MLPSLLRSYRCLRVFYIYTQLCFRRRREPLPRHRRTLA